MAEKYSVVVEVVELSMEETIKFASSFSTIEFSTSEKVTDRSAGLYRKKNKLLCLSDRSVHVNFL